MADYNYKNYFKLYDILTIKKKTIFRINIIGQQIKN